MTKYKHKQTPPATAKLYRNPNDAWATVQKVLGADSAAAPAVVWVVWVDTQLRIQ